MFRSVFPICSLLASRLPVGGRRFRVFQMMRFVSFGSMMAAFITAPRGSLVERGRGGVARFARFPLAVVPQAAHSFPFSLFALSSV